MSRTLTIGYPTGVLARSSHAWMTCHGLRSRRRPGARSERDGPLIATLEPALLFEGVERRDLGQARQEERFGAFLNGAAAGLVRSDLGGDRRALRRVITDAHGCKTLRDRMAVAPVAVPDHVVRRFIPGERIRE